MSAMAALDDARIAWERSQPQLQLFYGLVSGPTLTHPGANEPGEHGDVGPLTSRALPERGENKGATDRPAEAPRSESVRHSLRTGTRTGHWAEALPPTAARGHA